MPKGVYLHKPLSEEHKRKIAKAHKGKRLSEQHKINISKAMKKAWKIYDWAERNRKISLSRLGNRNPSKRPEVREKIRRKVLENYRLRPELRILAGKGRKGKPSPNKGKKCPWSRETILKTMASGKIRKVFNTKPELAVKDFLNRYGLVEKKDYFFQKNIQGFLVDFYFPKRNLILFVDGNYWHKYPNGTEKDKKQEKILLKNGYKIIRLWADDILKKSDYEMNKLISALGGADFNFIRGKHLIPVKEL